MKCSLSSICEYRKDKISVSKLNINTYISTENMIPNKGGITPASAMPSTNQTQEYKIGDVLVSNIRPYFKKIWLAKADGGCSNDVLVFKTKENVHKAFLYYVLSDDDFFKYAMATSKGTKMPRGDKKAIMQYQVPCVNYVTQKNIASILSVIDEKIECNVKINENLERQARAIYQNMFENIDSLPAGWHKVPLGEVINISNKSFNPLKEPETLLEHYSIPAYDDAKFPVFELSTEIKSNKFIIDDSCFMISKLNPTTKRVWRPYCLTNNAVCSTEFIVYKAKEESMTDYLYSVINSDSFSEFMCSHVTGSTGSRQRTTPKDTLFFEVIIPTEEELSAFQSTVAPMYALMRNIAVENSKLKETRDALLPKLMSGEIDVSKI